MHCALLFSLAAFVTLPLAHAQCGSFDATLGLPGAAGIVDGLLRADIAGTQRLFASGDVGNLVGRPGDQLIEWNGQAWSALADQGRPVAVYDMELFDAGAGPELHVVGRFALPSGAVRYGVSRYDGQQWHLTTDGGSQGSMDRLAVCDDGSGRALYVCGNQFAFNGVASTSLARWDGTSWKPLSNPGLYPIREIDCLPTPTGERLIAISSPQARDVHLWDGSTWSLVSLSSYGSLPRATAVLDLGSGPRWYVCGTYLRYHGGLPQKILSFDGASWAVVDFPTLVTAIGAFDFGAGPELVVSTDSLEPVWRRSAGGWAALDPAPDYVAEAFAVLDTPSGQELWVGGDFHRVGALAASHIARFDGATWSATTSSSQGITGYAADVRALHVAEEPSGRVLYAGGSFATAGDCVANNIARFDGAHWSALGQGVDGPVNALESFQGALFAGGPFQFAGGVAANRLARWDGASWSSIGGTSGAGLVDALEVHDDGGGAALFVAGNFGIIGGVAARAVARWDGAQWSALGSGVYGSASALLSHDDGSGAKLYVGGSLRLAPGGTLVPVLCWDGSSWSVPGAPSPYGGAALCLASFDDGGGPALYVGGSALGVGGVASHVLKLAGSSWSSVGGLQSKDSPVRALQVHDAGFGSQLYAAHSSTQPSALPWGRGIVRFDGTQWSEIGDSLATQSTCRALAVYDDPACPRGALYLGGALASFDGATPSTYGLERFIDPCASSGVSYCTSGTTTNGCTPTISGSGRASASSASGFEVRVTSVDGGRSGHLFYGVSGPHSAPWGQSSHVLCVKAPTQRMGTQATGGTSGGCDGQLAIDWNSFVSSHPGALGTPLLAGVDVWAQGYFRDPPSAKTTALSDALHFVTCP